MLQGPNIAIVVGTLFFLIVGFQLFLSSRRLRLLGYILPAFSLFLAAYNLYKSLFVYNPRPTMAEGIFLSLGLFGFAVSTLTLLIHKLYQGRRKGV